MKRILMLAMLALTCCLHAPAIGAQNESPTGIGIDQQLGKFVPLKAAFSDENGNRVTLGDLIKKPTILMLVYYQCPNICTPLMENVRLLTSEMSLRPGADYQIISISVDENEDPTVAAAKKTEIFKGLKSPIPEETWRFLTGNPANIDAVAASVGFHFKKQENQNQQGGFAHPAGLVILSPAGKITRYILGINYLPADVELALRQAAKGEVTASRPGGEPGGPVANGKRFAFICFSYNAEQGRYVLDVMRLVGLVTLLAGVFFVWLIFFGFRGKQGSPKP